MLRGAPVPRVRPPKAGEGVYCEATCRREQQRRNQATWRARRAKKETS